MNLEHHLNSLLQNVTAMSNEAQELAKKQGFDFKNMTKEQAQKKAKEMGLDENKAKEINAIFGQWEGLKNKMNEEIKNFQTNY